MEYFGNKSLSAVLYRVVTVLLVLTVVLAGLLSILFILQNSGILNFERLHLKISFGGISFVSENSFQVPLFHFIVIFLNAGTGIVILFFIRQILWNFRYDRIFIARNFSRIRLIGILVLAGGMGNSILNYLNWMMIGERISVEGYTAELPLISDVSGLVTGGIILFFAHLFLLATRIHDENELTI